MANDNRSKSSSGTSTLLTLLIVVAVLHFARTVFIPFALAVLLAFLLGPLVIRLRHWGWKRVPAAVAAVLVSFIVLGAIGMLMATQLSDLAHKLPEYQQNIHRKVEKIRNSGGGLVSRVTGWMRNFTEELNPQAPSADRNQPPNERPVPVEIRRMPFSPIEIIQKIMGSLLTIVLTAGIVIVFVLFMLVEREDLRDRLIRLGGARRVNLTTKVLDDAAERVSRYLLAQLVVNVTFGVLAGVGLYFIGVPNPVLWGILAALFRYIPYLGIWVAATMPAAVAFAVEPGWAKIPEVAGLYIGIDLLMYNLVEPLLYGSSTGVSPLAILVAAVFWTWLWGPVGLLLATPLTVCVVVIGRHVPNLGFLQVLLSDEPALPVHTRFYQRLLAIDLEEATEVAAEFLEGKTLEDLFDQVIIPALSLAEEDRHQGKLDDAQRRSIFQNARILLEDVVERAPELREGNHVRKTPSAGKPAPESKATAAEDAANVICIPARDEADELAAMMLAELLRQRGIRAQALSAGALASESLEKVEQAHPKIAAVAAVPPSGYLHARYLCRRLHAQFKGLKLIGAILTEGDVNEVKRRQPPLDADELASSLHQVVAHVLGLLPLHPQPAEQSNDPVREAA